MSPTSAYLHTDSSRIYTYVYVCTVDSGNASECNMHHYAPTYPVIRIFIDSRLVDFSLYDLRLCVKKTMRSRSTSSKSLSSDIFRAD